MKVIEPETWTKLLRRLLDLTRKGGARWDETANPYIFRLETLHYMYLLGSNDEDDQPPYSLRLHKGGTLVDSVETEYDVMSGEYDPQYSPQINSLLATLYSEVARKARGLERIQEDVLKDLESFEEPF